MLDHKHIYEVLSKVPTKIDCLYYHQIQYNKIIFFI